MKLTPALWLSQAELKRPRGIDVASVVVPLLVGVLLAGLFLTLGPVVVPLVCALLVLPWMMKKPFRLFFWLIISWPLLYLFLRIPLPAGIPDISYDRVLTVLVACIVLVQALVSTRQLAKATLLDILVILYIAAQIIARINVIWFHGVGSPDLNGFLDVVLVPAVLYWTTKNLLESDEHLKWFLWSLVIASLLICATGLYEQTMGVRIFKAATEVQYEWQDVPGGRAAGAMLNPAIYGAALGIGILAALSLVSTARRLLARTFLAAIIAILLYGVLASYTRSAWVSVLVAIFAAQFFMNGFWRKSLPVVLLGALLVFLIWQMIPGNSIILERALTTKTVTQRFDLISMGWKLFLQRPLLGWGSGALNTFGTQQGVETSHNIYLTFLVDGGLALFLTFFAFVGYLFVRTVRTYRMTENGSLERAALVAVAGGVLIYLLSGLALELRYFAYFNVLFWICAAVIDLLGARCSVERTVDR